MHVSNHHPKIVEIFSGFNTCLMDWIRITTCYRRCLLFRYLDSRYPGHCAISKAVLLVGNISFHSSKHVQHNDAEQTPCSVICKVDGTALRIEWVLDICCSYSVYIFFNKRGDFTSADDPRMSHGLVVAGVVPRYTYGTYYTNKYIRCIIGLLLQPS